jgi:Uma2 family endonuclease
MQTRAASEQARMSAAVDHIVVLHNVPWDAFERILSIKGDEAGPRIAYLKGELELMSPSIHHEGYKKLLARLLEAYADELDIPLDGYGGWTLKKRRTERGIEPDECYVLGENPSPTSPDLAIEVVWTHGGLDKLEIYRGLGVREVWIREDGKLQIHGLRANRYVRLAKSAVMPAVDVQLLASFVKPGSQSRAVKALRKAIRARPRRK